MRDAFAQTLAELAAEDERILLLTGDLGYNALEPFADRHPKRFLNVGVAEQNMVGLATGLAEAGFLPFIYSIATFATLRGYEFIRNGPVLHRLPVRIVGMGGGFEYGSAGATHHALEDIAVLRVHPGLTVVAPADYEQARTALLRTWDAPGPVYYRLGKDGTTIVPGLEGHFEPGVGAQTRRGNDLLIITMGSIASEAAAAAEELSAEGIETSLVVVSTLNPIERAPMAESLSRFRTVLAVEAHYINGGLGSAIAEVIAEEDLRCRLIRCGVRSAPNGITGQASYLHDRHGLTRSGIVEMARRSLVTTHK